jgi:predicted RND superfamily exporter protein
MNILKVLNRFKDICVSFVVNQPKKCLTVTLIPFVVLMLFVTTMKENYSVRMWFRTTDPHLVELDKFERDFGNDQMVLIGVVAKAGVFTPETMNIVREMTEETWKIIDIVRVDSLTNYNYVSVDGDNIQVEPFIPLDKELTTDYLAQKKSVALTHKNILDRLVNKSGTIALIQAQMAPKFDGNESNYRNVTEALKNCSKAMSDQALNLCCWERRLSMMHFARPRNTIWIF